MNENQVIVYEGNQITLSTPEGKFVNFVAYIRPNDKVIIDFDLKDLKVDFVKGDMHIIFPNGSSITIVSLLTLSYSDQPALVFDKKGNQISIDQFLNQVEVVQYTQATLILANRDEYKMSADKPDVVQVATDQDSTLEAGIPITGVGEADSATRGFPSRVFDPKGIVFEKNEYMGDGFYVVRLTFTNSPYNLDKDDRYPGNTTIADEPTLDYFVYYGSKLVRTPNDNMDNNGYESYQYSNGYDFTTDAAVQAGQNELDLSGYSKNIYVNNHTAKNNMQYKVAVDYSKGVFPNKITMIVPASVADSVSLDIVDTSYYTEIDPESGDTLYIISSPDPIGSLVYFINFDEGMDTTVFDVSYKLEYFNPSTGQNDSTYIVQSFQIKPVGTPEDVNVGATSVLSSTPNGMNLKTGSGNDVVTLGGGVNYVETGGGNDNVFSGRLGDTVFLGDGDDLYWASVGYDFVDGGDGLDTVYYNNTTMPTIDPSNIDFKNDYYNTYNSYTGVIAYIGFDKNSLLMQADKFGPEYSIRDYLANFLSDGDSLIINPANFAAYRSVDAFVFTYMDDKVTVGGLSGFSISLDGDYGVDTLIIAEDFISDSQSGAIIDLYQDSTTNASILNKSQVVVYEFKNFEAFYGSTSDDIFYSNYNPNWNLSSPNFDDSYYLYGNPTKTTNPVNDYDILSYEKLEGGVVVYMDFSQVQKHHDEAISVINGNITIDADPAEFESIYEFESIKGSEYADLYFASAKNEKGKSLVYQTATNSQQLSQNDLITYENEKAIGVTIDLSGIGNTSLFVYKSTTINSMKDQSQLAGINYDEINFSGNPGNTSDYRVIYTNAVDVFFSVEDKNILATDIDGAGGKDVLTYSDFTGGIKIDFTNDVQGIVYKQLNASGTGDYSDTFTYFTSPTYGSADPTSQNIGSIIGTDQEDVLLIGFWFFTGVQYFNIDYKSNKDGVSNAPSDILNLDSNGITDAANQGYDIRLGKENQVFAYDYTDPTLRPSGINFTFSGIYKINGSDGADIVTFKSDVSSLDEINKYEIDLAGGRDTVSYSNFQLKDTVTGEDIVLSITYDLNGQMVVEYVLYDDKTGTWSSLVNKTVSNFINVEAVIGTAGVDYYQSVDGVNLSYNGYLGDDVADYSGIAGDLIVNFSLDVDNVIKSQSATTNESKDTLENIYEIIGSDTGNNTFYAGQDSIKYTINNQSTQVNSVSYAYYEADSGVTIDYISAFLDSNGNLIVDANGNEISPDGSAVVGKVDEQDEISKNMSVIYGSNLSDTFLLYELKNGATKDIYGYDNTIAGNSQTTGIDTADFSKASSIGLDVSLQSTSTVLTVDTGDGFWVLHDITGLILTDYEDNVSLSGDSKYQINGLDGKDTVDYTGYNGTDYIFSVAITLDIGLITVQKENNILNTSYSDRLDSIEVLILSDNDDKIILGGAFSTDSITLVDAGDGFNVLDMTNAKAGGDDIIVNIDTITHLTVSTTSATPPTIDFQNINQIESSSNNTTRVNVSYISNTAGNTKYYSIYGNNALNSASTIIDFDDNKAEYSSGLTLDMSLVDASTGITYMQVQNANGSSTLIDRLYYINIDFIEGTQGKDTFYAGSSNNIGYNGSDGDDILSYDKLDANVGSGLTISLSAKTIDLSGDGSTLIQSYSNIETIVATNDRNDLVKIDDSTIQGDIININLAGSSVEGDYLWADSTNFVEYDDIKNDLYFNSTPLPLDISSISGVENLILSQYDGDLVTTDEANLMSQSPEYKIIYAYNVSVGNVPNGNNGDNINVRSAAQVNTFRIGYDTTQLYNKGTLTGSQFVGFGTLTVDANVGQVFYIDSQLVIDYKIVTNTSNTVIHTIDYSSNNFTNNVFIVFGENNAIATSVDPLSVGKQQILTLQGSIGIFIGSNQNDTFRFNDDSFKNKTLQNGIKIDGGDPTRVGQKNSIDLFDITTLDSVSLNLGASTLDLSTTATSNNTLTMTMANIQIIKLYDSSNTPSDYTISIIGSSKDVYQIIGGSQDTTGNPPGDNLNKGWIVYNQSYLYYAEQSFYSASMRRDLVDDNVYDTLVGFNNIAVKGGGNAYFSLRGDHLYNLDIQDKANVYDNTNSDDDNNGVVVSYKDVSNTNMIITLDVAGVTVQKYSSTDASGNPIIITDSLNQSNQALNINKIILGDYTNSIIIGNIPTTSSPVYTQDLIVDLGGSNANYYSVANSSSGGTYQFDDLVVGTALGQYKLTILNVDVVSLGDGDDTYKGDYQNNSPSGSDIYTIDGGNGTDTLDYTNMTNVIAGKSLNIIFDLRNSTVTREENGIFDIFRSFEVFNSGAGDDVIIFSDDSLTSNGGFVSASLGGGKNSVNYSGLTETAIDYKLTTLPNSAGVQLTANYTSISTVTSDTMFLDISLDQTISSLITHTFEYSVTDQSYLNNNTLSVDGGDTAKVSEYYVFKYTNAGSKDPIMIDDQADNIKIKAGSNGEINLTNFGFIVIENSDDSSITVESRDTLRNYTVNSSKQATVHNTMNYSSSSIPITLTIIDFIKLEMKVSSPTDATKSEYTLTGFDQIYLGKGAPNVVNLTEGSANPNTKIILIDASAGDDDTLSLSNYVKAVNINIDSSGNLSFTGYTLVDFEFYGLTGLNDTVKVTDKTSYIVLDGGRGKLDSNGMLVDDSDSLDYSSVDDSMSVIEDFASYSTGIDKSVYFTITFANSTGNHNMYSFYDINMSSNAAGYSNTYTVSSYDTTILDDSNFVSTTININFGILNIAGNNNNTFNATLSSALQTTYNISVVTNTSSSVEEYKARVEMLYDNTAQTIMTYNLTNASSYVGTEQNDIFVLNNVKGVSQGGASLSINGNSGIDQLVFDNYSSSTVITLILSSTSLDMASFGGTSSIYFDSIEAYTFGDEADRVTALAEGSTDFDLADGDNTFAYGDDIGSLDLKITSSAEVEYVFYKGTKGTDTVKGSLTVVDLSNSTDSIELDITTDLAFSKPVVINGKGGDDTFILTNYLASDSKLDVSNNITIQENTSTDPNVATYETMLVINDVSYIDFNGDLSSSISLTLHTAVDYNSATASGSTFNIIKISSTKSIKIDTLIISNTTSTGSSLLNVGSLKIDLSLNIITYEGSFTNVNGVNSQSYDIAKLSATITNLTASGGDDTLVLIDSNQDIILQNIDLGAGTNVIDLTANTYGVELTVGKANNKDELLSKDAGSVFNSNVLSIASGTVSEYYFVANQNSANIVNNTGNTSVSSILYQSTGAASVTAKRDVYIDRTPALPTITLKGNNGNTEVTYGKVTVSGFSVYEFGLGTSVIIDSAYAGNDFIEVKLSNDQTNKVLFGFDYAAGISNSATIKVGAVIPTGGVPDTDTSVNFEYNVNTKIILFNLTGGATSTTGSAIANTTDSSDTIIIETVFTDSDSDFTINAGGGIDKVYNNNVITTYSNFYLINGMSYYIRNIDSTTAEQNLNEEQVITDAEVFYVKSSIISVQMTTNNTNTLYQINAEDPGTGIEVITSDSVDFDRAEYRDDGMYLDIKSPNSPLGFDVALYGNISKYTFKDTLTNLVFLGIPDDGTVFRNSLPTTSITTTADFSQVNVLGMNEYTIGLKEANLISVSMDDGSQNSTIEIINFEKIILQKTPNQQSGVHVIYDYDKDSSVSATSTTWVGVFFNTPGNQTITITSAASSAYTLDTGSVGNLSVHIVKALYPSNYDVIFGNWITQYNSSVTISLGNANFDSVFSRDIELNEDEGLISQYNLSNEEDNINIIGMEGNLIVDTGKGHDNISLYGRAEDYTYTYSSDNSVVIDGYTYYTGGNMVVLSNGSGQYMYFFNTTLDEMVMGGTYVDESEFYSKTSDNDQALLNYDERENQSYYDDLDALRPSNSSKLHNSESNNNSNDTQNNASEDQNVNNQDSSNTNNLTTAVEINLDDLLDITNNDNSFIDDSLNAVELDNNIFDTDVNLDSLNLDSLHNTSTPDNSVNVMLKDFSSLSNHNTSINEIDIIDNYKLSDEEDNSDSLHQMHTLLNKHNQNSGNHS